MTRLQLVLRSLVHHRRMHCAVALGVAAATAVLTGALLVGDSVRGSLHSLTLERLGKIEAIMALDHFFRRELVTEFSKSAAFAQQFQLAAPAILFPQATLEHRSGQHLSRASAVLVLGCDNDFWQLDVAGIRPAALPAENEVVLNAALAAELHVQVGDDVTLRLAKANQVPADSPLANKNDRIRSLPNLRVVAVVPTRGLGRFNLQATQSLPLNAFVSIKTLQDALEQPDRINAIIVGGSKSTGRTDVRELSRALRPNLADFAVSARHVTRSYQSPAGAPQIAFEYFSVSTDRMIFDPKVAAVIDQVVEPLGGQRILTYLANSLEKVTVPASEKPISVPYSMVTAIDVSKNFQLMDTDHHPVEPLASGEIVLNSWTADSLGAKAGDRIRMSFFRPETTHGEAVEQHEEFTLKGVVPLMKPARPYERNRPALYEQPPTAANDPDLTPEVAGVTDQETIDNWDAPFPFDYKRVRKVDEEYWDYYRTTPKAFISYPSGKTLWGSRFGDVTSYRIPKVADLTFDQLRQKLERALADKAIELGFDFVPIKQRQLDASRGTTPFDVLFLSLSFFVIAAALLMVALLFRLGIDQRATEIGTLLAVGYTRRMVGRIFVAEGFLISALGSVLGLAIGIGYARLMLLGLRTWWLGAISAPFLSYHWSIRSLLLGYGLGVVIAMATIAWGVRQTRRVSVRALLGGRANDDEFLTPLTNHSVQSKRGVIATIRYLFIERMSLLVPLAIAISLSIVATRLGGMAQAGAFVAGGAALLMVLLLFIRRRLRHEARTTRNAWDSKWLLWTLAERSAARNPTRSVITVGLMATATFLIVAMSSFRLAPTARGVGGFRFIAQSAEPVFVDLNNPDKRSEYFGPRAADLSGSTILGLRLRPGEDASCQNLYQSTQPRVLGVTAQFVNHFDSAQAISFNWAGFAAQSSTERNNPWRLLAGEAAQAEAPVPAILDKNTALYSLHLYRGIGEEFTFEYDRRPVRFRVVGLLENSILQGSLLIGDADFRQSFPSISGFRYFLIGTPLNKADEVAAMLEDRFGDQGLDVTPALDVLEQLLAVQNTYLSTFQTLGALGLLLGALGLSTVQLRNVLERRGELAVLRAVGYRRRRLAQLVLIENVVLLAAGLLTGIVAALLAVLPHKFVGDAAISWLLLRDLSLMLAAVFLAGLFSSVISIRAVLKMPLLAALRGE